MNLPGQTACKFSLIMVRIKFCIRANLFKKLFHATKNGFVNRLVENHLQLYLRRFDQHLPGLIGRDILSVSSKMNFQVMGQPEKMLENFKRVQSKRLNGQWNEVVQFRMAFYFKLTGNVIPDPLLIRRRFIFYVE